MQHSLRYYQHSGPVIYKSKLPAPSVSMPCDYRILQSPTKELKLLFALPILQTSAKSVQTTAEVCTDYTCSLHRLQLSAAL